MLGFGIVLLAVACGDDVTGPKDPSELDFDPELGVHLDQMTLTSMGLYYQDLVVGTGDPTEVGKMVWVHFDGWLHDGTKFDSSYDRGEPFSFMLGVGVVIPGWELGIQGMKVGGIRKLVIPPHLAYGAGGSCNIPPNSTLVFDVEVVDVSWGL